MRTYLLDILNRYNRFSENLDVKTILCNKSWLIFNDTGDKELYIFQENGSLIASVNGKVINATWQYVSANKSIIISFKEQSYMLHPTFLDKNIFALQQDGTNRYSFMSANKSIIISFKEQSYMLHPTFLDKNIFALQQDGTNRYSFMIDEKQSQSFKPKSLSELNSYFENIECKRIEEQEYTKQISVKRQKEYTQSLLRQEQELKIQALKHEAIDSWERNHTRILNNDMQYRQICKSETKEHIITYGIGFIITSIYVWNGTEEFWMFHTRILNNDMQYRQICKSETKEHIITYGIGFIITSIYVWNGTEEFWMFLAVLIPFGIFGTLIIGGIFSAIFHPSSSKKWSYEKMIKEEYINSYVRNRYNTNY